MPRCSQLLIQRGSTMIEVLVAIVVLTLGLLGLAGLQSRLQVSEMEAYQRSQALILVNDMASRLAANRANAAAYATYTSVGTPPVSTLTPLGAGACPTATGTRLERDLNEWCNALQGAGETSGSTKVGTLVGGQGCVESLGGGDYRVTVAWQGYVPVAQLAVGSGGTLPACGSGSYAGGTGSSCAGDLCRRLVSTVVRIPTL